MITGTEFFSQNDIKSSLFDQKDVKWKNKKDIIFEM